MLFELKPWLRFERVPSRFFLEVCLFQFRFIHFKYLRFGLTRATITVWHHLQNSRINTVVMSLSSSWSSNARRTSGKEKSFCCHDHLVPWSNTCFSNCRVTQNDNACDVLQLHLLLCAQPHLTTRKSHHHHHHHYRAHANLIRPPSSLILEHDTTPFLLH